VNVPNLITLLRILLVPVVVFLIATGSFLAAFWVFVAAGATDAIDGFLARRWNQRTELGAYLDALADKALLVSIFLALAIGTGAKIPLWLAITVISRDMMIIAAVILSWLLDRPLEIHPHWVSKLNTAVQIAFAAAVLAANGYNLPLEGILDPAVWVVGGLTLASATVYVLAWARHMSGMEARLPPRTHKDIE